MNRVLWSTVIASVAVLGLLLAFHQVVSGAVLNGKARQQVAAAQADAAWRCNAQRGHRAQDGCGLQLAGGAAQADAPRAAIGK